MKYFKLVVNTQLIKVSYTEFPIRVRGFPEVDLADRMRHHNSARHQPRESQKSKSTATSVNYILWCHMLM